MNADSIQKFFISHGEKLVVGIVVAVSGWLAYSGLGVPSILDEQQPERLLQDANTVRASIDEDHTEEILKERKSDFQIVAETVRRQRPIDHSPYSLPNLMERRSIDTAIRRNDPVLAAPQSLQTFGVISSVALLSPTGNYKASELEGAEPLAVVETKPKVQPRSNRRNRANMMMEGMDPSMMDSSMMGMDPSMMMDSSMMDPSMMSGPQMMPGSMATPQGRTFDPAGDFGHRPVAKDTKKPVPVLGLFIAGTAVLPHKAVAESFKAALAEAEGYQPMRDQPLYYDYQVQRADVTEKPVDQLKEADWILVRDRERDLIRALSQWAGFSPELVPEDYRDPQVSGYIPPVLLTDYSKFTLHPLIPMVSRQQKQLEQAQAVMGQKDEVKVEDLELAAPGMAGGVSGMGSDMSYGMEMSYEGMSGMGGYAMTQVEVDPVEFKIMRFFDFASQSPDSIRLGRSYVYRVRYAVVDPNFPANPIMQPKVSALASEVYTRIEPLMAQATATQQRDYRRWSEWSEASPPSMLPPLNDYYAGPVQAAKLRTVDVNGKKVTYPREQPSAKIVNHALSVDYATRMPIWMENVRPGSTLSYKGAAEVIDPIALTMKKVPEAEVRSQTTIIDMEGGNKLPLAGDDETMTEPSLMLIFDENGNLKVTGEVADQEMYRIYSFAKERGL